VPVNLGEHAVLVRTPVRPHGVCLTPSLEYREDVAIREEIGVARRVRHFPLVHVVSLEIDQVDRVSPTVGVEKHITGAGQISVVGRYSSAHDSAASLLIGGSHDIFLSRRSHWKSKAERLVLAEHQDPRLVFVTAEYILALHKKVSILHAANE
jgi:hypothetical protein